MGDVKEYMSVAQAAADLGLTKARVNQLIGDGKLTVATVLGGMRLLRRKDVIAFKPFVQGKAGRPRKEKEK